MEFRKKTLSNGLRVIVAPMKSTRAVTLLVFVGSGSANEEKRINGISHFLEHLYFKGTKSRPSAKQVAIELERLGAEYNAFTSQEVTGYWVKAASKHFDIALDIVSDILIEPIFQKEEVARERNVILQEMAMYRDVPQRSVFYLLYEILYGNYPMGRKVIGEENIIKRLKREDIIKYKNSHYKASNTIVIVAGKVNPDTAFKKVFKAFSKMRKGKVQKRAKTKSLQKGAKIKFEFKKTDQTHLVLGARAYAIFDKRKYALNLLSVILGGGMSSRLFTEIREKLGLSYYVRAAPMQHLDVGHLAINMGVAHHNLEKAVSKTMEVLADIKENGVTPQELSDAKDAFRGKLALSFESSDEIASFYGEQELFFRKIEAPEAHLKRIEKVSQNDIIKVARDIFMPNKMNLVVIGPHKEKEIYKKMISNI